MSNLCNTLPYSCIYLDVDWKSILCALKDCLSIYHSITRKQVIERIRNIWTKPQNQNFVLPCLSVRSGLDLYLQVQNFPPGSEIIVSAVNIPDIPYIIHHHGLQIVSLDIDVETTAPKIDFFEHLISKKTVALLVAHIYGKIFDLTPFIEITKRHNLVVIEDSAEGFCGFNYLGHPEADITLFSFGTIKYCTCLGGAIAKIRDKAIYEKMDHIQDNYSCQSSNNYLKKIMKCCLLYLLLDCPNLIKPILCILQILYLDYRQSVTKLVRGFPGDLMYLIRFQPSLALLLVMLHRFETFSPDEINICCFKGEYVSHQLANIVTVVGHKSPINTYWLFPIIVKNPFEVMNGLNSLGVEAHRSSTQLTFIESDQKPEDTSVDLVPYYPHEAKHLMKNIIYLPVTKAVPFHVLDQMTIAVKYIVTKNKYEYSHKILSKL
ncbi:uncharacterized protein LOC106869918 [Octopus bimaculoides]|uniref:Uncharacterized protein n=1 Tax=Octopus bimaculoides TaxID=37653 RepID=A0A0L8IG72_OCTBM|nr:uncharacterized protein LOC106869918 [Octopus bimaculoides]|eukprot:XP_014771339.1 PREDICTED: uncharacterized protein LOC106869918 [Octopus bimaculoides]